MAVQAVELAGFGAGAHPPEGIGVVFAEIPPIGVKIRILQGYQVIIIAVAVPRREGGHEGAHLGMTGGAGVVILLVGEVPASPDDLEILWGLGLLLCRLGYVPRQGRGRSHN